MEAYLQIFTKRALQSIYGDFSDAKYDTRRALIAPVSGMEDMTDVLITFAMIVL